MRGRDFVAFASKVALLHTEEAARRTAISRAYYGAMHESIALLRDMGLPMDARHDNASLDFKASLMREGLKVGHLIDALRSGRVTADYRLERTGAAHNEVIAAIERATEVISMLDQLRESLSDVGLQQEFLAEIRAARAKTGRRV